MDVSEVIAKARVLLEALPYIQDFRGATFVVKYGGCFSQSQLYLVKHHRSTLHYAPAFTSFTKASPIAGWQSKIAIPLYL